MSKFKVGDKVIFKSKYRTPGTCNVYTIVSISEYRQYRLCNIKTNQPNTADEEWLEAHYTTNFNNELEKLANE